MTDRVDVLWWNLHPDVCSPHDHWDTGLLQDLYRGDLWRPPEWPDIHEADGIEPDRKDGAVVMVPGNFHRDQVAELNAAIAPLDWVLVVLHSDEDSSFPWERIRHPNFGLWIMTPSPAKHPRIGEDERIFAYMGEGYQPGTPQSLAALHTQPVAARDWWFYGRQGDNGRRDEMMAAAKRLTGGTAAYSPGFTQGFPRDQYLFEMARTKIALAPSGICTPGSFRAFEALEAGSLPLVDARSPAVGSEGYWDRFYPGHPWPEIHKWGLLPAALKHALADWPSNANRSAVWWQRWKRDLAYNLRNSVRWLRGDPNIDRPRLGTAHPMLTSEIVGSNHTAEVARIREKDPDREIMLDVSHMEPLLQRALIWRAAHWWDNVIPSLDPILS